MSWLRTGFLWLLLCVATRGHVVLQIYGEVLQDGPEWRIEVLFDVGYSKPEWRGDPDSPPPTYQWLTGRTAEEHAELRRETERYLRECLKFSSPGGAMEVRYHFPDFDGSRPGFLRMLNDGAYYRVRIEPVQAVGGVSCILAAGERPDFVFELARDRFLTLKPGESFALSEPGTSSRVHALISGFRHVLPGGWDHVLFIFGLFLLAREWRPLLWQSLAFTVAHTVTLGLAASGAVQVGGTWVEPMIALSIAALAMENLFHRRGVGWRIAVVFVFGLVHGLGFASALSSTLSDGRGFLGRLISANLGVELAQISILATAWLATAGWHGTPGYERFRLAANVALALVALCWFSVRVF